MRVLTLKVLIDGTATESLFKMEARVLEQHILIRIHCQKHKGLLVNIIAVIQSFELFVVNNSVLAFGDSILDITIIAEVKDTRLIIFFSLVLSLYYHYLLPLHCLYMNVNIILLYRLVKATT